MRLPSFKSITAVLVIGTATAIWQAHERSVDKKNIANSIRLVKENQAIYAERLRQSKLSTETVKSGKDA